MTYLGLKFVPRHTGLGVQCQEEDGVVVVILLLAFHWQYQEMSKLSMPFRSGLGVGDPGKTHLRVHSTGTLFPCLLPYFCAEAHDDAYEVLGLVRFGDATH